MKVPREEGRSKLNTQSIKSVLVGYFGKGDYKLLKQATSRMFRSCDIVFKMGTAHHTLSDKCNGDPADLLDILDMQLSDIHNVEPHDMQPAGAPNTRTEIQTKIAPDISPDVVLEP